MSYTHFQFIAYEVPTVVKTADGGIESGWLAENQESLIAENILSRALNELRSGPNDPVISLPGDELGPMGRDAYIRLARLAYWVDKSKGLVSSENHVLKIFTAPEFYFRPCQSHESFKGTYPDKIANYIFQSLEKMFASAKYNHWIFICGTVLRNIGRPFIDNGANNTIPCFNSSLVVRGGALENQEARSIQIEKVQPSGIDGIIDLDFLGPVPGPFTGPIFVSHFSLPNDPLQNPKSLPNAPLQNPKFKLNQMYERADVRALRCFRFRGIQFGLEICLDHRIRALIALYKPSLLKEEERPRWLQDAFGDSNPDTPFDIHIHVLIAGGMSIIPENVVAKDLGYIVRNDGMYRDWNALRDTDMSQMKQVTTTLEGRQCTEIRGDEADSTDLQWALFPYKDPDNVNFKLAQKVVIYPLTAIPA